MACIFLAFVRVGRHPCIFGIRDVGMGLCLGFLFLSRGRLINAHSQITTHLNHELGIQLIFRCEEPGRPRVNF